MKHLWNQHWYRGIDPVLGLEIETNGTSMSYHLLKIRLSPHSLTTEWSKADLTLEAVQEELTSSHLPILLSISGSLVMEKILPDQPIQVGDILGVGLTSSQPFLLQRFPLHEGFQVGAAIRKDTLNQLLEPLGAAIQRVVSIGLSPLSTYYLWEQQANLPQQHWISLRSQVYKWQEGRIEKLKNEPTDVAWEFTMPSHEVVVLGHCLGWLQGHFGESATEWLTDQPSPFLKRLPFQRISQVLAVVSLSLLFLLMGRYWWFRILHQEAESFYYQNSALLSEIQERRRTIQEKEAIWEDLSQNKVLDPQLAGWKLDQMAQVRPKGVQFRQIILGPTEEGLSPSEWKNWKEAQLVLQGEASGSEPISNLALALERLDFVGKVVIEESQFSFRDQVFQFTILLFASQE